MNLNELGGSDEPILDEINSPQQEATMPLGVGEITDEGGVDVLASAGSYKRFRAGSLVLVLVVVGAAAGLFSMRFLAETTAAFAGNTKFEKVIDDFFGGNQDGKAAGVNDVTAADASVLGVLSETYTEHQVPLANVLKNPFIVFEMAPVATVPMGDDGQEDNLARERERLRKQQREAQRTNFEQAATRLYVKSILMGSNPLANVNNRIVHIGDVVPAGQTGVEFRVITITADSVTVAAADPRYDLIVECTLRIHGGA